MRGNDISFKCVAIIFFARYAGYLNFFSTETRFANRDSYRDKSTTFSK